LPTPTDLAQEFGTDPRNIIIHIRTVARRGNSLGEWIQYLESLPSLRDVAEELGVSISSLRKQYISWLEKELGDRPEHYYLFVRKKTPKGTNTYRVLKIRKDFIEWFKKQLGLRSRVV